MTTDQQQQQARDNRDLIMATCLTADDYAKTIGRSASTVADWLRGKRMPDDVRRFTLVLAGWMPWPGFERFRVNVKFAEIVPLDQTAGVPVAELGQFQLRLQELRVVRERLAALEAAPAQYLLDFPA